MFYSGNRGRSWTGDLVKGGEDLSVLSCSVSWQCYALANAAAPRPQLLSVSSRGAKQSLVPLPNSIELPEALDCPLTGECFVGGDAEDWVGRGPPGGVIVGTNDSGRTWVKERLPQGAVGIAVTDISCPSASRCWAVGDGLTRSAILSYVAVLPKPSLASISPDSATPYGGLPVTIYGTNLEDVTSISFGSATVSLAAPCTSTSCTVGPPTRLPPTHR